MEVVCREDIGSLDRLFFLLVHPYLRHANRKFTTFRFLAIAWPNLPTQRRRIYLLRSNIIKCYSNLTFGLFHGWQSPLPL